MFSKKTLELKLSLNNQKASKVWKNLVLAKARVHRFIKGTEHKNIIKMPEIESKLTQIELESEKLFVRICWELRIAICIDHIKFCLLSGKGIWQSTVWCANGYRSRRSMPKRTCLLDRLQPNIFVIRRYQNKLVRHDMIFCGCN